VMVPIMLCHHNHLPPSCSATVLPPSRSATIMFYHLDTYFHHHVVPPSWFCHHALVPPHVSGPDFRCTQNLRSGGRAKSGPGKCLHHTHPSSPFVCRCVHVGQGLATPSPAASAPTEATTTPSPTPAQNVVFSIGLGTFPIIIIICGGHR